MPPTPKKLETPSIKNTTMRTQSGTKDYSIYGLDNSLTHSSIYMPSEKRTTLNSKKPETPPPEPKNDDEPKPVKPDSPTVKSDSKSESDKGPKEKTELYKR